MDKSSQYNPWEKTSTWDNIACGTALSSLLSHQDKFPAECSFLENSIEKLINQLYLGTCCFYFDDTSESIDSSFSARVLGCLGLVRHDIINGLYKYSPQTISQKVHRALALVKLGAHDEDLLDVFIKAQDDPTVSQIIRYTKVQCFNSLELIQAKELLFGTMRDCCAGLPWFIMNTSEILTLVITHQ